MDQYLVEKTGELPVHHLPRSSSSVNLRSNGESCPVSGKKVSVVEEIESQQREKISKKLKELQRYAGRTPLPKDRVEIPIIIDSSLARTAALPRIAYRRNVSTGYQAVTPAAFSLKGTPSEYYQKTPNIIKTLARPNSSYDCSLRFSQSLTSLDQITNNSLSAFTVDNFGDCYTKSEHPDEVTVLSSGLNVPRISSSLSFEIDPVPPPEQIVAPPDVTEVKETAGNVEYQKLSQAAFVRPQSTPQPTDLKSLALISETVNSVIDGKSDARSCSSINYRNGSSIKVPMDLNNSVYLPPKIRESSSDSDHILSFCHSNDNCSIVTKDKFRTRKPHQEVVIEDSLAGGSSNADRCQRSHFQSDIPALFLEDDEVHKAMSSLSDTDGRPSCLASSFETHLCVDVNTCDFVIPSLSNNVETRSFATAKQGTQLGHYMGLQSDVSSEGPVLHQKTGSLLSDSNTVDSGVERSDANESPCQESPDDLDSSSNEDIVQMAQQTTPYRGLSYDQHSKTTDTNYFCAKENFMSKATGVTEGKDNESQDKKVASNMRARVDGLQRKSVVPSQKKLLGTSTVLYPQPIIRPTPASIQLFSSSASRLSSQSDEHHLRTNRFKGALANERSFVQSPGFELHHEQHTVLKKNNAGNQRATDLSEHRKTETTLLDHCAAEGWTTDSRNNQSLATGLEFSPLGIKHTGFGQLYRQPYIVTMAQNKTKSSFVDEPMTEGQAKKSSKCEMLSRNPTKETRIDKTVVPTESLKVTKKSTISEHMTKKEGIRQEIKVPEPEDCRPLNQKHNYFNEAMYQTNRTTETVHDVTVEMTVQLVKSAIGLGFCIEGGVGSPIGDRPITVKRLFKGESAAAGKLQPGDVILAANGLSMSKKSHFQAWNFLKSLPEGPVSLDILRGTYSTLV